MSRLIRISDLLPCLHARRKGYLHEAFPGEEPDFVQQRDKECTGITLVSSKGGFSAEFNPPIFLRAGVEYVFGELPDA